MVQFPNRGFGDRAREINNYRPVHGITQNKIGSCNVQWIIASQ